MHQILMILLLAGPASLFAQNRDTSQMSRTEFQKFSAEYEQLKKSINALEKQREEINVKMRQHDSTLQVISEKLKKWETRANAVIGSATVIKMNPLLDATKQMQETQMSFNLQYLQLQSQMQHENRSYTAISNIMKTKHETVKNSISNVR